MLGPYRGAVRQHDAGTDATLHQKGGDGGKLPDLQAISAALAYKGILIVEGIDAPLLKIAGRQHGAGRQVGLGLLKGVALQPVHIQPRLFLFLEEPLQLGEMLLGLRADERGVGLVSDVTAQLLGHGLHAGETGQGELIALPHGGVLDLDIAEVGARSPTADLLLLQQEGGDAGLGEKIGAGAAEVAAADHNGAIFIPHRRPSLMYPPRREPWGSGACRPEWSPESECPDS